MADAALPLLAFLAAALWLAALAERSGLAQRAAAAIVRRARGSGVRLYALTCLLCAAVTSTVSLDGAVVVLVPLVAALAHDRPQLRRTLLLGAVAVANAFSLAVPQGNPTNLVVMRRLGLGPADYVAHMALAALVATAVCALAIGWRGRRALDDAPAPGAKPAPWTRDERFAAAALGIAAAAGATAPWLGLSPLWAIVAAGALAAVGAPPARISRPPLVVPWAIGAQIAVLVAVVALLPALHLHGGSLLAALAVALSAAALAGAVNNLPASVAFAGVLGAPGLGAYAALTGLSVGALATPRGSVATMIAFRQGGAPHGHREILATAGVAATVLAVASLWAVG